MLIRLLFLLLVALNLGAAGWLLLGRAPAQAFPPRTDPGVPELRLLSEVRIAVPLADANVAPTAPIAVAPPQSSAQPPARQQPGVHSESTPQPQPSPPTQSDVPPQSPPASPPTHPEPPLPAGTAPDMPAPPSSAPVVASRSQSQHDACATLGPFDTAADMRAAMQDLTPRVERIQYRQESVQRSHGYWVYLPAAANREAALSDARKLAAKGITDYYVVTAGDTQNTISLGLFHDPANAKNRLARLQELGFAAKLEQRVDTENAYWIDFAAPAGSSFRWQVWLPGRSDLQSRPIDCF